jgi:hypothetical protein
MRPVHLLLTAVLAMSTSAAVGTVAIRRHSTTPTTRLLHPTSERPKHTPTHPGVTVHAHQTFAGLPVYVDGANAPDLIPEQLAYRHLMMALSIRSAATPEEVQRRTSLAGHGPQACSRRLYTSSHARCFSRQARRKPRFSAGDGLLKAGERTHNSRRARSAAEHQIPIQQVPRWAEFTAPTPSTHQGNANAAPFN